MSTQPHSHTRYDTHTTALPVRSPHKPSPCPKAPHRLLSMLTGDHRTWTTSNLPRSTASDWTSIEQSAKLSSGCMTRTILYRTMPVVNLWPNLAYECGQLMFGKHSWGIWMMPSGNYGSPLHPCLSNLSTQYTQSHICQPECSSVFRRRSRLVTHLRQSVSSSRQERSLTCLPQFQPTVQVSQLRPSTWTWYRRSPATTADDWHEWRPKRPTYL